MVTSPTGLHTPPALDDTTIIEAKIVLSFASFMILRTILVNTIVVVRLSNTADIKKDMMVMISNKILLLLVLI